MTSAMGELALIERIRAGWGTNARAATRSVPLGIGDDCAILRPPRGHEVLVTTDFTLEGRHFRRDWHPAESVGHRALARGLSDLAAMGARPLAAFLSLALPADQLSTRAGRLWVERFFTGRRPRRPACRRRHRTVAQRQNPRRHRSGRFCACWARPAPQHGSPRRPALRHRNTRRSRRRTGRARIGRNQAECLIGNQVGRPIHCAFFAQWMGSTIQNPHAPSALPPATPSRWPSPSGPPSRHRRHRPQRRPIERPRAPMPRVRPRR